VRAETEGEYRLLASKAMVQTARNLRQRETPVEVTLWECLRNRRLDNLKFRRQHPIAKTSYVADFLCYEARLIVELDGGIHETQAESDAVRQTVLESEGYRVIRFKNALIETHLEDVLVAIVAAVRGNSPHPPAPAPEGEANSPHPPAPSPEGEGENAGSPLEVPLLSGEGFRVRANVRADSDITKWDIFYYVYGLLHHPEYRTRYADNLKRELPRIPFVPSAADFWAFAEAGKKLADLHLNYETVEPYELEWVTSGQTDFRVTKMRLSKDKTTLIINPTLTLKGIPAAAFDYRLGNRSALEWVVDQYQVSTDKRSGITHDPNGYSDDKEYIVRLVERVVTVSVETVKIVAGLPTLGLATAVG